MFEEKCANTGLKPFDCNCLDCSPSIHRFKFLGLEAECKNIDDIISAIQSEIEYFQVLKEKDYTIGGAIADDYMEIYPPKQEGFYWGRCRNRGHHIEIPTGEQQPERCQRCEEEVEQNG